MNINSQISNDLLKEENHAHLLYIEMQLDWCWVALGQERKHKYSCSSQRSLDSKEVELYYTCANNPEAPATPCP